MAFLVAACAPNATGSLGPNPAVDATGAPTATAAPTRPPLALNGTPLEPCAIGSGARSVAVCGELTVAEDPADPTGQTIGLRVAVIPAVSDDPAPDPVFVIAGGPGGSAVETLAWTASTFWGVHASRDIVLVDQRGTGGSNAMLIDPLPDLSGKAANAAEAAARDWVASQLGDLTGNPALYTTSIAMDDLDAVRAALGYDHINLWGGSYGATAAQYYIRQHEDRVRSIVVDGATLLEVPVFERIAANSQAALDALFARCAADAGCNEAYPDLQERFKTLLAKVANGSIQTDVSDPATGEPMVIDLPTFTGGIHSALIDAEYSAMLPWFIDTAADGHWQEAIEAANAVGGDDPNEEAFPLMSAVIRCSEAWAVYDPAEVARTGAGSYYLEAQLSNARLQETLCRYAPDGIVQADDAAPATSDVPVLFTVGSADPQDPPANIAVAPQRFPNSLTIVAEGHGHTVSHRGCLPSIVDAFIEAGTAEGLDTSCVADGVPLPSFRLP